MGRGEMTLIILLRQGNSHAREGCRLGYFEVSISNEEELTQLYGGDAMMDVR